LLSPKRLPSNLLILEEEEEEEGWHSRSILGARGSESSESENATISREFIDKDQVLLTSSLSTSEVRTVRYIDRHFLL
jgi:hypothetical protein